KTAEEGLRLGDLLSACDKHFTSAARVLTRSNCRQFIQGLPEDTEIRAIEAIARRRESPYRLLSVA
ncbi:MAG: hypothetical protein ACE5GW_14380, partial [Planctomycetota bacterium]